MNDYISETTHTLLPLNTNAKVYLLYDP